MNPSRMEASEKKLGEKNGIMKRLASVGAEEWSCGIGLVCLMSSFGMEKLGVTGIGLWVGYGLSYFFLGQEGVKSAWESLKEKEMDVDVLMVLAAIGAAIIGAPFEGALLLFLFSFSNVLQKHAMERTHRAIESLLVMRPKEALVRRGGEWVKVAVEEIAVGEVVRVKPGEQMPMDGELVAGETEVDESTLTGESVPVTKGVGMNVYAGTMNQRGAVEVEVKHQAKDSVIARMVKLVADAQQEKSTTQRFLEDAERYYAMGVVLVTVGCFLVCYFALGNEFAVAMYRAMTLMVVASPCALVISTPATVLSAIGGAAKAGVLIKGGSHLERMSCVDIVAIDKTGTLTHGKPKLIGMAMPNEEIENAVQLGEGNRRALMIAAALEAPSEHPLAHAVMEAAKGMVDGDAVEIRDYQAIVGKGAKGVLDGQVYWVGNERLFMENAAQGLEKFRGAVEQFHQMGCTCIWLGRELDGGVEVLCLMGLRDMVRSSSRELIEDLHRIGVKKVVMLTGDQESVAERIGKEVGVDEVRAGLLPEDKLDAIRELRHEGVVMMVGDGINDAPALALSDVGVAMGAVGTDVAMETAHVVLMGDQLENLPLMLAHAQRAKRVMIQNLAFASLVILVLIISVLGVSLPLPLGVVGHEGSTVLVCLNGLRLLSFRRQRVGR